MGKYIPRPKVLRKCTVCSETFYTSNQRLLPKFCSKECRASVRRYSPSLNGIASGTVGAIAELAVSIDLMKNDFEVYRALSPSSSCDILALKNGISYKFEIRTGRYRNTDNQIIYPKKNIRASHIVVVTFSDNKLHYFPPVF